MTEWSDNRVEQLKKLWEAGLSASQIAAELGGISRNAAIGKIHRLGLVRAPKLKPKQHSVAAPSRAPLAKSSVGRNFKAPRMVGNAALAQVFEVEVKPEEACDNVLLMHRHVTLMELTSDNCHWPIGDPQTSGFVFCGGEAVARGPYCAHHTRISVQPAGDRRRAKD